MKLDFWHKQTLSLSLSLYTLFCVCVCSRTLQRLSWVKINALIIYNNNNRKKYRLKYFGDEMKIMFDKFFDWLLLYQQTDLG